MSHSATESLVAGAACFLIVARARRRVNREYVLNAIQVRLRFTAHLSGINRAFVSLAWAAALGALVGNQLPHRVFPIALDFQDFRGLGQGVSWGSAFGIVIKALCSVLSGALCPTIRTASTSI